MTVYEAINTLLSVAHVEGNTPDVVAAGNVVAAMLDAYDALAPDWSRAPEWAQWVTIFDNGKLVWWELEPEARIMPRGEYAWRERDGLMGMARAEQVSPLPLGIDWRLCKWSRPEAAR